MNIQMIIAFSAGMLILAATPGPGVFGAMSKALSGGFKASLLFIGGLALGDTIFFLLALGGMSAISRAMGDMFLVIKIAGGIYLFYLGIKMLRSGIMPVNAAITEKESNFKSFIGGLLLTLGNPKPILFYASVLPVIIDISNINPLDAAVMIIAIVSVSFIVLGTYSYLASLSGKFLTKKSAQVKVNRIAGTIMCVTGTYIALK